MTKAMVGFMLAAVTALAAPVTVSGTGTYGSFTGTMEYFSGSQNLVINLTNTTPLYGGYITGVAFNNPGGAITAATMTTTDSDFVLIGGPDFDNSVSGSPFGDFDLGTSLGSSWLGSGSPTGGLAVGSSATFTFTLSGALAGLTTDSFTLAASENTSNPEAFVVRFRGMLYGQSDKVPGEFGPPPPPPGQVPEPTTYALIGAGLALVSVCNKLKK